MSPGTVWHLCRPLSTESTNPAEAAHFSLNPPHTSAVAGALWVGGRLILQQQHQCKSVAICSWLHFARLCRLILASTAPPSWDRLARFGLGPPKALLCSTGWPGLVWLPTILCTVQASCVSRLLPTAAVQRSTGPGRPLPTVVTAWQLLPPPAAGRVQPTGECPVKIKGGKREGERNCVDTHM